MQPLPIVPMIGLLTESNAPAWVAAALLPVLLGIAAWALVHTRGGQREHCTAGAGATGFTAAPVPPPLPPPLVPGLPVLGSALALGAGGAAFLERCREQVGPKTASLHVRFCDGCLACHVGRDLQGAAALHFQFLTVSWRLPPCRVAAASQHGDAFTLRLLGQRMTFVFAPPALERYFTAPDSELTFGPAVQQASDSAVGLSAPSAPARAGCPAAW